jgi:hypothetical protein
MRCRANFAEVRGNSKKLPLSLRHIQKGNGHAMVAAPRKKQRAGVFPFLVAVEYRTAGLAGAEG